MKTTNKILLGAGLIWLLLSSAKKGDAILKYFTLDDVTDSNKATVNNYTEQFNPPRSVYQHANDLCRYLINPVLDWIITQANGQQNVTYDASSWYRAPRTNEAVGGSSGSDHLTGGAMDLNVFIDGEERNDLIVRSVLAQGLPFKQLIIELGTYSRPAWIHLSYEAGNNDREILRNTGSDYVSVSHSWAEDYYL